MEFFLKRSFERSRARWWQLLAAACIAALFGFVAIGQTGGATQSPLRYVLGGAAIGFAAGLILLWIDAGRSCRDARGDFRMTWRERALAVCVVLGMCLGPLSAACGVIMGFVRLIAAIRG